MLHKNVYRTESLACVIASANIIFSTTGKDISQQLHIDEIVKRDKIFISCSSGDKEFLTLLQAIAKRSNDHHPDPFTDVIYSTPNGARITILDWGTPINFNRTEASVPAQDIAMTRGLLFGANLQAALCAASPIEAVPSMVRHDNV